MDFFCLYGTLMYSNDNGLICAGYSVCQPSISSSSDMPLICYQVFYTLYMDSSEDLSYEEEEEVLFWDDVILEDDNIDKEDYEFEDKDEHALEEIVCNGIVYDIEQVEEQELFLNEVIESSYTYRDDVYENEPGLMER
ncbi:hypothetical protein S245_024821 [Arachis hypogaea]